MWTILKIFTESVTILFLFYVFGFFGPKACGILAHQPGMEPEPPSLEGEVLTSGPPGKFHIYNFWKVYSDILFHCCVCFTTAPNPGIEPTSPTLVGRFFTTGPPRKSSFFLPQPNTLGQWFFTLADAYNYLITWGALTIIQISGPNFQSFYFVVWGEAWELIYA